jgi:uncharacterized protein (TIGR00304 family)
MHFSQYLYSDNRLVLVEGRRYIRNRRRNGRMLDLVLVGLAIVVAGFFVLLLATVISGESSEEGERRSGVRGGGVIMIGPIPVVFGSDAKWASIAIVLAIVLVLVVIVSEVIAA